MSLLLKKSTINWCESDYYYSMYIAEMYNSLTGFFLCGSSILFYYNYKDIETTTINQTTNYKNKKVLVYLYPSIIMLFFIGIGTFLFHGTLLYIFQLLDELPMLLLCIEYHRILTTLQSNPKSNFSLNSRKQYLLLQIILCITIAAFGFINDLLQSVSFQLTILLFFITDCIKLYNVFVNHNTTFNNLLIQKKKYEDVFLYEYTCLSKLIHVKNHITRLKRYNKELKYSLLIAVLTSIISVIVWKYDQLQCHETINNTLSGHAMWHILTSIALYNINKMIFIFLSIYH